MDDPLFNPDDIPVDETIDYLASLRDRTIAFVLPEPAPAQEAPTAVVATGTDGVRAVT